MARISLLSISRRHQCESMRPVNILLFCPLDAEILTSDSPCRSLFNTFWEQIDTWYPILHAEDTKELVQAITSYFPMSITSCLTLLVLAIGCVTECDSVLDARRRRPEAQYIEAAMEMLPCVYVQSGPRSAQCLLLFAIYHLCYGQPFQAYDFAAMASLKLQSYIIK